MPSAWNGTLIRDLDYASAPNSHRNLYFLEKGYAVAGTARHDRRWVGNYDPIREIAHLNTVHSVFEDRFGKPKRVIQHGCSGGGALGLIVAEYSPERVDGVIAMGTHAPSLWFLNQWLDGWVALNTLLEPELSIALNMPGEPGSLRPTRTPLTFAWRQALNAAQQTPEGRARIALALTIAQLPDWTNPLAPRPDRNDPVSLQQSMYRSAIQFADNVGGLSRYMFESSAGLGVKQYQVSWNTGVDYKAFFGNGNKLQKQAVEHMYTAAGLDLEADLARLNAAPRKAADPEGLKYWTAPGRFPVGNPRVPILRMHEIGDPVIPVNVSEGYASLIRANGREDLYRMTYAEAATHCDVTVAESAALLQTMMKRLDTGTWDATDAVRMNELGKSLDQSSVPRFIPFDNHRVQKYNRTWLPGNPTS
jgi:pimeloyl-ACP methyl ester carboxylesterase